jgi:hypothetical protein
MKRLLLLLIVAVGLAPGTWWRSPPPARDFRPILKVESLDVPPTELGEDVALAGAWHLSSSNFHFHGYSALLAMDDGSLLAVSDRWRRMRLAPPGAPRRPVTFGYFSPLESEDERGWDIEGVTRDPASGRLWGSYERSNYIERYDSELRPAGRVGPAEMRDWPSNRGAESIVRLADGRFIVLAEGSPRWFDDALPALLFPGDPVEGAKPAPFRFVPPDGYAPVDMAELPDGRVLILLRAIRWGLPPRFEGKLVVADPADIRRGKRWRWREIAHLAPPLPMDNYEGLAIGPDEGGRLVLWVISDDNRSMFQRTLLLKLLWRPK